MKTQSLERAKRKLSRDALRDLDASIVTPHGDRYLVKKWEIGKVIVVDTPAGPKKIEMAELTSYEETHGYYLAVVVNKGNGHRMETDVTVPMPFEPGQTVLVEKYSGRELMFGSETYIIVNQVDILAAIDLSGYFEKAESA